MDIFDLVVQGHFGVIQPICLKMTVNVKAADRREKPTEIRGANDNR